MTRRPPSPKTGTAGPPRALALVGALVLAGASLGPDLARAGTPGRQDVPAVERLTGAFTEEVRTLRAGTRGGAAALAFTASGEAEDEAATGELGRLVERLLESDLRDGAGYAHVTRVPGGDVAVARAAARRGGATDLVVAALHRVGGELVLSGTVEPTWVNFWTGEPTGSVQAVTARVRADRAALLLARAAPGAQPATGSLRLRPLTQLEGPVTAVAVGDADGDGRAEILVLTDRALTALRLEGGSVRRLAVRSLASRPRALVRSREPAGGVVVARIALRTVVAYNHSDLASGEILAFDGASFEPVADLPETPLAAGAGTVLYAGLVPGTSDFQGAVRLVGPSGSRRLDLGAPVRSAALGPDGRTLLTLGADWRLTWRTLAPSGDAAVPEAAPVGAGVALADVDGDGVLERVGSEATAPGAEDRLVVATARGAVRELRPVPGAIRALAAGDATGDGRDDVVVAASAGDASWLYLLSEDGS